MNYKHCFKCDKYFPVYDFQLYINSKIYTKCVFCRVKTNYYYNKDLKLKKYDFITIRRSLLLLNLKKEKEKIMIKKFHLGIAKHKQKMVDKQIQKDIEHIAFLNRKPCCNGIH
jgi:hypothetical protein